MWVKRILTLLLCSTAIKRIQAGEKDSLHQIIQNLQDLDHRILEWQFSPPGHTLDWRPFLTLSEKYATWHPHLDSVVFPVPPSLNCTYIIQGKPIKPGETLVLKGLIWILKTCPQRPQERLVLETQSPDALTFLHKHIPSAPSHLSPALSHLQPIYKTQRISSVKKPLLMETFFSWSQFPWIYYVQTLEKKRCILNTTSLPSLQFELGFRDSVWGTILGYYPLTMQLHSMNHIDQIKFHVWKLEPKWTVWSYRKTHLHLNISVSLELNHFIPRTHLTRDLEYAHITYSLKRWSHLNLKETVELGYEISHMICTMILGIKENWHKKWLGGFVGGGVRWQFFF